MIRCVAVLSFQCLLKAALLVCSTLILLVNDLKLYRLHIHNSELFPRATHWALRSTTAWGYLWYSVTIDFTQTVSGVSCLVEQRALMCFMRAILLLPFLPNLCEISLIFSSLIDLLLYMLQCRGKEPELNPSSYSEFCETFVRCYGWKGGSGEHQVLCASSGWNYFSLQTPIFTKFKSIT